MSELFGKEVHSIIVDELPLEDAKTVYLPQDIGRDVSLVEVVQYGFKPGRNCGGCDHSFVKRAVGKKTTRNDDGTITEGIEWQKFLCPLVHDRFLRRMERRLAVLDTGRVHWQKGLEPENFGFSMMFAVSMLDYQDAQAFRARCIDTSVWPWRLRAP